MNKFMQKRKRAYLEEMTNLIIREQHTIPLSDRNLRPHVNSMTNALYWADESHDVQVYATPAPAQMLGGEDFSEENDTINIPLNFYVADATHHSDDDYDVPMLLTWHDPEVDVRNFFQVIDSLIPRIYEAIQKKDAA